jgi:hypothetical protein
MKALSRLYEGLLRIYEGSMKEPYQNSVPSPPSKAEQQKAEEL